MFEKCSQCVKQHNFECPHGHLTAKEAMLLDRNKAPLCSSFMPVPPPPPRMTAQEFYPKQEEMLKDIPKQFHGALAHLAWEQGHSSGFENVLCCLSDLIDDLKEPIKAYGDAVVAETTQQLAQKISDAREDY